MKLPSPALIVATAALFVALGGTSYAVMKLPKNSVGSEQIKNGSIRAADLSKAVAMGAKGATGAKGADAPIPTPCTWVTIVNNDAPVNAARHTICKNQDLVGRDIGNFAYFGDFTESNLTGAGFYRASMTSANLTRANLAYASLRGAHLDDATLVGTNLTGAHLDDAADSFGIIHTVLTNADLTGANLTGANLTGATGTPASLVGVTWNNTTCPDGTNSNTHGNTCVGFGF